MKKEMNNKEIGYRIMSTRLDHGYSRECLSELAGISAGFLYEIERGLKGFSACSLMHLAEVLEVSADSIMTGCKSKDIESSITKTLEKFDSSTLEMIEQLLNLTYEIVQKSEK